MSVVPGMNIPFEIGSSEKVICSRRPPAKGTRWSWAVSAKRVAIRTEPSGPKSSKLALRALWYCARRFVISSGTAGTPSVEIAAGTPGTRGFEGAAAGGRAWVAGATGPDEGAEPQPARSRASRTIRFMAVDSINRVYSPPHLGNFRKKRAGYEARPVLSPDLGPEKPRLRQLEGAGTPLRPAGEERGHARPPRLAPGLERARKPLERGIQPPLRRDDLRHRERREGEEVPPPGDGHRAPRETPLADPEEALPR